MAEKKVQPKSPKHEGVDPLTTGETLHPKYDTKAEAEKLRKAEAKSKPDTASDEKTAETVKDQNEVNAQDSTPNDLLPENDENSREASDVKSSEPDAPKSKSTGSKSSSR